MRPRALRHWLGLLLVTLAVVGVMAWQRDAGLATAAAVPASLVEQSAIDAQVQPRPVIRLPSRPADASASPLTSTAALLPLGPALQHPAPADQSRLLAALASLPRDELAFRAQIERLSGAPPSPVVDAWLIRRRDGTSQAELRKALELTWQTEPIAVRDAGRRMLTRDTAASTKLRWRTGPSRIPPLRRASER